MTITAKREAKRSGYVPQDLGEGRVGIEKGRMEISFGPLTDRYTLGVDPTSFEDLVQVMLRSNADEAIKAFANALKDGIPANAVAWYPAKEKKPPTAA
jgi:hypothetical protein